MTGSGRRVLYASTSDLPSTTANSVAVVRMCEAMVQEGCDVSLVGRRVNGGGDPREAYGVDVALRVLRVRAPGPPMAHRIPYLACGTGQVVRHRPDVVYSRDPLLLLTLPRRGAATVYEVHHPVSARAERAERSLLRMRPPTLTVFISHALAAHYLDTYPELDPARVMVAPSGAIVGPPVPESPPRAEPVIGYVGHVAPGRSDILVELARALPHRELHVYGRGDGLAGAPPNLTHKGVLEPAEVPAVLRTLDVCLAPYAAATSNVGDSVPGPTGAAGGSPAMSPLKVLEYMGQGRAVVASDLPTIRELVRPGIDAELCPPHDVAAWGRRVEELCRDAARRSALGGAARARVEREYSWAVRARRVIDALDVVDGIAA